METLTIILFITVIILLILIFLSKSKENALKQEIDLSKSEHKFALSDIEKRMNGEITNQAGAQFQKWRESECEKIRLQQLDIAKREAKTLLEEWKFVEGDLLRADAISRSQSVILGKVTEHLIPYLPKFNYNPKDVRFFGDPIDLIVFDGLNDGFIKEIVFIEVKTGSASRLSRKQQDIRDAIRSRPIKWVSMRVNHEPNIKGLPITIEETKQAIGRNNKIT
ncbi:MAG: hypothetical protein M3033_17435 [Acidobacteriota bacterium]|nr:hypothetical protein [Acidobacteriota bacterium]